MVCFMGDKSKPYPTTSHWKMLAGYRYRKSHHRDLIRAKVNADITSILSDSKVLKCSYMK